MQSLTSMTNHLHLLNSLRAFRRSTFPVREVPHSGPWKCKLKRTAGTVGGTAKQPLLRLWVCFSFPPVGRLDLRVGGFHLPSSTRGLTPKPPNEILRIWFPIQLRWWKLSAVLSPCLSRKAARLDRLERHREFKSAVGFSHLAPSLQSVKTLFAQASRCECCLIEMW